jgi:hypothetical protein
MRQDGTWINSLSYLLMDDWKQRFACFRSGKVNQQRDRGRGCPGSTEFLRLLCTSPTWNRLRPSIAIPLDYPASTRTTGCGPLMSAGTGFCCYFRRVGLSSRLRPLADRSLPMRPRSDARRLFDLARRTGGVAAASDRGRGSAGGPNTVAKGRGQRVLPGP